MAVADGFLAIGANALEEDASDTRKIMKKEFIAWN